MGSRRNNRHGPNRNPGGGKAPNQKNETSEPIAVAPESQPQTTESNHESSGNEHTKNYERRIANWTAVVGAFTVVLAVATAGSGYVLWQTDHTLKETLQKSQRPWVIAENVQSVEPGYFTPEYAKVCPFGYRVHFRNTGNSVANELIFSSRTVRFPPTWDWLRARVEALKASTLEVWSAKRPAGLPVGITLAPNQPTVFAACPAYGDGSDPTPDQTKTGAFLVIGYLQYKDQFGIAHHGRFAFSTDSDSVHLWDGKSFTLYNDYQEAD
jgi:hypothetical protein